MNIARGFKGKFIAGFYFAVLALSQGCGGGGANTGTTTGSCTHATPPTFSTVQTIFANNCDYCHGHSFETYSTAYSSSANIYSRVSNGSMPQGASLSAADLGAIQQWIACGSKQ
ncbi:MAG: hypothetical protein ACXVCY_11425 [Pseudobdellovibrionaceae bacterium]